MKRKLQVFVSSTYKDLIVERQAAVAAILKAGHIPAGMELFTAGDKSQLSTIERWIDDSDVYMLILGGRYGSIEPSSGIGYTELEYDYAISKGKPTFAVVVDENALEQRVKLHGTSVIETENPKALRSFRAKVLTNISSFFSDEKDVRLCVFESVGDYAADTTLKGWVSASEAQDVVVLRDQVQELTRENAYLKNEVQRLQGAGAHQASEHPRGLDRELYELLAQTKVTLPATIRAKLPRPVEPEANLLALAFNSRELLSAGFSVGGKSPTIARFLHSRIIPNLRVHGLIDSESTSGGMTTRYVLSSAGGRFFAEIEKQIARDKKAKGSADVDLSILKFDMHFRIADDFEDSDDEDEDEDEK